MAGVISKYSPCNDPPSFIQSHLRLALYLYLCLRLAHFDIRFVYIFNHLCNFVNWYICLQWCFMVEFLFTYGLRFNIVGGAVFLSHFKTSFLSNDLVVFTVIEWVISFLWEKTDDFFHVWQTFPFAELRTNSGNRASHSFFHDILDRLRDQWSCAPLKWWNNMA